MGKAQKLKAERKRARKEAEIKRKKRKSAIFKYLVIFLVSLAVGSATYFSYHFVESMYDIDISEKISSILGINQDDLNIKEENQMTVRKTYTEAPEMQIDISKEYIAKFETNKGNFEAKLYAADSPKTVNNFVVLSRDGFYNGLTFHRIIKDFMIQGGDPEGTGTGGPGYQFEDEFNDHNLVRGSLAMANSGADTNGSQFFIVTAEATDWLDGKHTNFGEIVSGLDIVMEMEKVETGENDKPTEDIIINNIEIEEK